MSVSVAGARPDFKFLSKPFPPQSVFTNVQMEAFVARGSDEERLVDRHATVQLRNGNRIEFVEQGSTKKMVLWTDLFNHEMSSVEMPIEDYLLPTQTEPLVVCQARYNTRYNDSTEEKVFGDGSIEIKRYDNQNGRPVTGVVRIDGTGASLEYLLADRKVRAGVITDSAGSRVYPVGIALDRVYEIKAFDVPIMADFFRPTSL